MGWNAENQSIFVGLNLGPTLEAKGFGDVKIMIMVCFCLFIFYLFVQLQI